MDYMDHIINNDKIYYDLKAILSSKMFIEKVDKWEKNIFFTSHDSIDQLQLKVKVQLINDQND
jgi:hypothetical protein